MADDNKSTSLSGLPDDSVTSTSGTSTNFISADFKPVVKKKFGTKVISGLVNAIPDGMLTKVLAVIVHKLIGKIPDEKKEELWSKGSDLIVKLATGVAEGAARGTTSELKGRNN